MLILLEEWKVIFTLINRSNLTIFKVEFYKYPAKNYVGLTMDQLNDVQGAFSNPDFIETQPILIDDNIEEEDFDASTFV